MNGQLNIDSLFAFIIVDDDGTEGVPAVQVGELTIPLMGADLAMVKLLRPHAVAIAHQINKPVSLVHFSQRTLQEVIEP